ncbi:hypothetical protein J5N97_013171 [Dioscorea zingiberensis]|uniref:Transcription factor CBF/NF-Y/archaeal histone domain-containing protein n=1 Tax=Dioscorea zingiberensis TaxID=325984 RepID=A0A9D5CSG0_9LILI|nr:hypothetical protein J5N97_013171 [Dioscorea zingiberensis]
MADSIHSTSSQGCITGQDHLLPIANVGKIMKQALPPSAKISKEAKETMQECASEFIGFVTGEASERCRKEKRKTINGEDVLCAFKTLGLDQYADVMQRYMHKYREHAEKSTLEKHDKSIQIDITDELSILRRDHTSNNDKRDRNFF